MLYKKNQNISLDDGLFRNPSSEYRGAPFWAWNCRVSREDVDHILEDLKAMGMGGAHLHSRTGMALPYLEKEFMDRIRYSHQKAGKLDMLTWLYDEDRWPSGAAGGLVTKDPAFRQRFLVFSPEKLPVQGEEGKNGEASVHSLKGGERALLVRYAIRLEGGFLTAYQLLDRQAPAPEGFDLWYLYEEVAGNNPWYNNQAYVDTLNPKAIGKFIEITHEAYCRELGDSFGESVPAIFTDEPQFCQKSTLGFAEEKKRVILPYTDDFADTYREAYGCDFFETFPECIWELPDGEVSVNRYHYHDHVCERFTAAFADQIGAWCRQHGIALTGHMLGEETLQSQTSALGEAMRSYRSFDLPGIDMLCDNRELSTAKQAQSAVHQFGREGMLSEIYGVTNWDFDFRGHKLAGDWQAALGVTIRVHHLTWTSMAGEAKRDYPASIGYQSPWYREYPLIENYFARLNTALTRGTAEVKVGVIHPVESYWLYWGAKEQTNGIRQEMDDNFRKLTEWLLFGLIDFDFISEALWKQQTPDEELDGQGDFLVGKMKYEVILVPNCVTIRRSTLERLRAFRKKGGRVIFTGTVPTHVDAVRCSDAADFAASCEIIGFAENLLTSALLPVRTVDVHNQDGVRVSNMLYQMRQDSDRKWLFLAHCMPMKNPDIPNREDLTIRIRGEWRPVLYDAMTGEIREVPYEKDKGDTLIRQTVFDHDSLLYALYPAASEHSETGDSARRGSVEAVSPSAGIQEASGRRIILPDDVEVSLEEPDVAVLDLAEASFDGGPWQERDEILRIDNKFRAITGYPMRIDAFPQPWVEPEKEEIRHRLALRFRIHADREITKPFLALENAEETKLTLNGVPVPSAVTGYYVDRAIRMVALPDLKAGENILTAEMPYYNKFNVEVMYLLGDFGVRTAGHSILLTEPVRRLAFGDICGQGLPFYGGNLTYKIPVNVSRDCTLRVEATQFRCPVIGIRLDGQDCGRIAFSPYSLEIRDVKAGEHLLEITAFGNRVNTFGTLHNCNHTERWFGPNAWRTTGPAWAYEYQLRPGGILISPVITEI